MTYSEFHKRHGVYKSPNFFHFSTLTSHFEPVSLGQRFFIYTTRCILYPLCLGMCSNSIVVLGTTLNSYVVQDTTV